MTDRDQLIEIMAEARFDAESVALSCEERFDDLRSIWQEVQRQSIRAALAAAEAAGFTIVPPDDGR